MKHINNKNLTQVQPDSSSLIFLGSLENQSQLNFREEEMTSSPETYFLKPMVRPRWGGLFPEGTVLKADGSFVRVPDMPFPCVTRVGSLVNPLLAQARAYDHVYDRKRKHPCKRELIALGSDRSGGVITKRRIQKRVVYYNK